MTAAARPSLISGLGRLGDACAARAELGPILLSCGAWAILIAAHRHAEPWTLCIAGRGIIPPLAALSSVRATAVAIVMLVAMMAPLVAFQVKHVVTRSYPTRQVRGAIAFLAGYFAPWLAVALVLTPIVTRLAGVPTAGRMAGAVAFGIAAIWQLSVAKVRALRRCTRTVPLRQDGWRADRACVAYGTEASRDCMAACWAMMLAVAFRPHDLAAMALVQALATGERYTAKPCPRLSALALASAGAATLWI